MNTFILGDLQFFRNIWFANDTTACSLNQNVTVLNKDYKDFYNNLVNTEFYAAQKMKFSIMDFFCTNLLKKPLMENFIFCAE